MENKKFDEKKRKKKKIKKIIFVVLIFLLCLIVYLIIPQKKTQKNNITIKKKEINIPESNIPLEEEFKCCYNSYSFCNNCRKKYLSWASPTDVMHFITSDEDRQENFVFNSNPYLNTIGTEGIHNKDSYAGLIRRLFEFIFFVRLHKKSEKKILTRNFFLLFRSHVFGLFIRHDQIKDCFEAFFYDPYFSDTKKFGMIKKDFSYNEEKKKIKNIFPSIISIFKKYDYDFNKLFEIITSKIKKKINAKKEKNELLDIQVKMWEEIEEKVSCFRGIKINERNILIALDAVLNVSFENKNLIWNESRKQKRVGDCWIYTPLAGKEVEKLFEANCSLEEIFNKMERFDLTVGEIMEIRKGTGFLN